MKRKIKIFGTALLALMAAAAMAAGAASASEFKAASYPAEVHGAQLSNLKFTFTGDGSASAECETVTTTGTLEAASSTLELHPEYSGCKAFGFLGATITTEGCNYVFHAGAPIAGGMFGGTASIVCEGGSTIKIAAATCEVKIGSQEELSSTAYRNMLGSPEHITAIWEVSELAYTVAKDGFLCPLSGTGSRTNGDITGLETLTAKSEGSATALTVEGSGEHQAETAHALETEEAADEAKATEEEEAAQETGKAMGGGSPLTSEGYPAMLDAEQDEESPIVIGAGEQTLAECASIEASGTLAEASSTFSLLPSFAGCQGLGFTGETVEANGCELRFHVWSTSGEGPAYGATMDVLCDPGREIVVTSGTCEAQIGPQWGLEAVEAENVEGTPEFVAIAFEVTGLAYEVTGDGLFCPLSGLGEFSDGSITGSLDLSGTAEGEPTAIAIEM